MRVLSYNIHKGYSMGRTFTLERIRQAIRTTGAELVFLQEVQGHHRRWSKTDWAAQLEYLADEVWTHYSYGQNAVYDEGHHGNAILSKWPLLDVSNQDISNHGLERRGLLHGRIHHPELGGISLGCVHLDLTSLGRRRQMTRLLQWTANHSPEQPWLLAGDWNDWDGQLGREFSKASGADEAFAAYDGRYARTFPAWWPVLPLDRIFVKGLSVKSARRLSGPPWNSLSDHVPIFCELTRFGQMLTPKNGPGEF